MIWLTTPQAAVAWAPWPLITDSKAMSAIEPVTKNRPVGTPRRTVVRSIPAWMCSPRRQRPGRGASTWPRRRRWATSLYPTSLYRSAAWQPKCNTKTRLTATQSTSSILWSRHAFL